LSRSPITAVGGIGLVADVSTQLHPDCVEVLRRAEAWGAPARPTVEQARALDVRRMRELGGAAQQVAEVRELAIPTHAGDVPARLYRPCDDVADGVLVWLHGGGWMLGSPDTSDDQVRALTNASRCAVLSVDYRLAPEHRFPAGLEDAYAAVSWAAAHPEELGAPACRLAVGGDSAGGNLAAAVTLMARDRGGPPIEAQLLVYPALCRELEAPSRERYAEGYWLTAAGLDVCWERYLARPEDALQAYASPLLAESFAGLPPAVVLLAECDVLHDEGERYARRLEQAGVPTQLHVYPGMLHGFLACAGVVRQAWDALELAGRAVGDALRSEPSQDAEPAARETALSHGHGA